MSPNDLKAFFIGSPTEEYRARRIGVGLGTAGGFFSAFVGSILTGSAWFLGPVRWIRSRLAGGDGLLAIPGSVAAIHHAHGLHHDRQSRRAIRQLHRADDAVVWK